MQLFNHFIPSFEGLLNWSIYSPSQFAKDQCKGLQSYLNQYLYSNKAGRLYAKIVGSSCTGIANFSLYTLGLSCIAFFAKTVYHRYNPPQTPPIQPIQPPLSKTTNKTHSLYKKVSLFTQQSIHYLASLPKKIFTILTIPFRWGPTFLYDATIGQYRQLHQLLSTKKIIPFTPLAKIASALTILTLVVSKIGLFVLFVKTIRDWGNNSRMNRLEKASHNAYIAYTQGNFNSTNHTQSHNLFFAGRQGAKYLSAIREKSKTTATVAEVREAEKWETIALYYANQHRIKTPPILLKKMLENIQYPLEKRFIHHLDKSKIVLENRLKTNLSQETKEQIENTLNSIRELNIRCIRAKMCCNNADLAGAIEKSKSIEEDFQNLDWKLIYY